MGRFLHKRADAIGSGTADPSTASARAVPVPQPAVENKPAPGQRGPAGLSGRTTYSRVNTGTPPTPDMGASAQKSQGPRGLEFLPKTASQENETKDLALRLQSSHIQLRETKLQMKEFEAKLAALLCEKGTMLVMGSPPKCEALKEK